MRASSFAELPTRGARAEAVFIILVALSTLLSAQSGRASLDPAFRLPAGGLALAGPIIDDSSVPAAAWLVSEDRSLYALSEEGKLSARINLADRVGAPKPDPVLAMDRFGRVLVLLGSDRLSAFTRMGALAWETGIEAAAYPPAFGSDGRSFVLSGGSLLCLNPAGRRLWKLPLPSPPSCPPGVDGRGFPCAGLADGSLLLASPYGELGRIVSLGSPPQVLLPFGSGSGRGTEPPSLAAGLVDGSLLLIGPDGNVQASYHAKAAVLSLASDGPILYGLDAAGEAFALSAEGQLQWTAPTACAKGRLYLFAERLVAVGQGRAVSLSLGGETFRELTIPGASGTPAVSPAGLVFSSGKDWILAAYRFERQLGALKESGLRPYPELPDIVSKTLLFDPTAADSGRQLTRLADIEKSLRLGTIGRGEPEAAAYCAAVATGALDRDLSETERRHGANPLPRARACYLLGELGSPSYREPLFRVLEADADSAVRAAACEALADMGVDEDGRSMAAFLRAAARPIDEETALVIAAAIEGMALRSGLAPSEDGLRALVALAAGPYGQTVRDRASAALARISGTIK